MTQTLSPNTVVMGTRGSPLALAQARQFARALEEAHPGLTVEEKVIRTTGDKNQSASLPAIGGKGVFTLEIEQALLDGSIDFAVHSLKDLPPDLPVNLELGCLPQRASACDVCVLHQRHLDRQFSSDAPFAFLPNEARVGTSSTRRAAQLSYYRPDLEIESVRGNIDTRLRKLQEEGFDAILLARAGLDRLGVETPHGLFNLDEALFVPAPGQGALAIENHAENAKVKHLLAALDDVATRAEVTAERALLRALNAGCTTPIGARATAREGHVNLKVVVLSPEGTERIEAHDTAPLEEAATLGQRVADQLRMRGAGALLAAHD